MTLMGRGRNRATAPSPLARRVAEAAVRHRLFRRGEHIVAAVSGGPDSVALLSVLAELAPGWNLSVSTVHIEHGLRGAESLEDARFVQTLSARMGLTCVCESVDVRGTVERESVRRRQSLQHAARDVRYCAMSRVAASLGATKIALGHTADDQAETLLMWMLRGAGQAGLAGIPPVRESLYIHPLLEVSRAEILEYVTAESLPFREDSSNAKPMYVRNRLRLELMPLLKRFNPSVVKALGRQAAIVRDENAWLDRITAAHLSRLGRRQANGELLLDREGVKILPIALQRRLIRLAVQRASGSAYGPRFDSVGRVLAHLVDGQSGSTLTIDRTVITREYRQLRFAPRAPEQHASPAAPAFFEMALPIPSTRVWPLTGQVITVGTTDSISAAQAFESPDPLRRALFDADTVTPDLMVRSRRPGDMFQPAGMGGRRKKLQDYFADRRLPRRERSRTPLIVAPEGIIWVAGHRMDHRFRLRPTTTRTLIVTLHDPESGRETR